MGKWPKRLPNRASTTASRDQWIWQLFGWQALTRHVTIKEALNKSSQRAITRLARYGATCSVGFFANIQILAAKPALHPIPIRAPRICEDLFSAS